MSAPRWRAVPPLPGALPNALWCYVIAPTWVAAVPVDTDDTVVQALRRLRATGATTLEAVIAVIPLFGEHAVADFAVAELREAPAAPVPASSASVIVRGVAAVDVFGPGGTRRHSGRGIQPWLLADFRAVTALSVSVAAARPINEGELPPPGATASADGDGQWAEQGGAGRGVLTGRRLDLVLGVPGAAEPGAAPRQPDPAESAQRMRVADEIYTLDVDSYIGRRPRVSAITTGTARLITVAASAREVSATHLRVSQQGQDVVVTDLESTNGTLVELPDGSQLRLVPLQATAIAAGSRLLLGDDVVIELLGPAEDGWPRGR